MTREWFFEGRGLKGVFRGEDVVKDAMEGDDSSERKTRLLKESGIVVLKLMDLSVVTQVHGYVGSHPRSERTEVPLFKLPGGFQHKSGIVATVFMDISVVTNVHGCVGSHPRFRRIEVPLPELAGEVQRAVQILLVLARTR